MHTDEYEISIAREIIVCKRFTAKLGKRLEAHARQFGANDPDEAARNLGQAVRPISEKELKQWREDIEALAFDIFGPHVNIAFHAKLSSSCGSGDTVLARSRLSNDTGFAHAFG